MKNIVEKRINCSLGAISPLFHYIFAISLTSRVQLHIYLLNVVVRIIFFLNSANLICRGTDISEYFRESFGIRDNESRLYMLFWIVYFAMTILVKYEMYLCMTPRDNRETNIWKMAVAFYLLLQISTIFHGKYIIHNPCVVVCTIEWPF